MEEAVLVQEILGLVLLEHLVFADYSYYAVMRSQYGEYRISPMVDPKTNNRKIDTAFYKDFYDCEKGVTKLPMYFYQKKK